MGPSGDSAFENDQALFRDPLGFQVVIGFLSPTAPTRADHNNRSRGIFNQRKDCVEFGFVLCALYGIGVVSMEPTR